jgi:Dolichyl-phosphate-mannose-protein mannosyltransferase
VSSERRGLGAAKSARIRWAVAGSVVLGLVLRALGLRQSLYGDELYSYLAVVGHSLGHVVSVVHRTEQTPPLFFIETWGAVKIGDPTVWIRIPSVLLGTACIPLTYLLGKRTVGAEAGALAALLLAVSPFALFYGDEARAYSTVLFFMLAASCCLLRSVQERDTRWLIGFVLLGICAVYTHYIAIFPLGIQALWLLMRFPEQRARMLLAHLVVVLALVPWLLSGPSTDQHGFALLYPVTATATTKNILHVLFGLPFVKLSDLPGTIGWMLLAAAGLVAVAGWLSGRLPRPETPRVPGDEHPGWLSLVILLAISSPAGILAYSVLRISIDAPRNMIVSLPAACLVAGAVLAGLRARSRTAMAVATTALMGALLLSSVSSLTARYRRPPWQQAADVINASSPRGAVVLQMQPFPVTDPWGRHPLLESLAIYLRRDLRPVEVTVPDAQHLLSRHAASRPTFAVLGQITGFTQTPAPPDVPGVRLLTTHSFNGFAPVAVFNYGGKR